MAHEGAASVVREDESRGQELSQLLLLFLLDGEVNRACIKSTTD